MPVTLEQLLDAFDIVNVNGAVIDNAVYLCRETGAVHWQSDYSKQIGEKLSDGIEDETKYVRVPDKFDLDLGQSLVFDFTREVLPDDYEDVRDSLRKKGGYRRFRALVQRRRVLERWYAFEKEATRTALRDWCEVNGIELTD